MENKVSGIQKIINDRADDKLRRKIDEIHNFLNSQEIKALLKNIQVNVGTAENPRLEHLFWVCSGNEPIYKKIVANNTERYREMETTLFMNKVESLREEVDGLLDRENY